MKVKGSELWAKAQTTGEIISRSGTPINSASKKEIAIEMLKQDCQQAVGFLEKMDSIFWQ